MISKSRHIFHIASPLVYPKCARYSSIALQYLLATFSLRIDFFFILLFSFWISYRYKNYESLSKAIEKTRFPAGATNTADALTKLVTTIFDPTRGDRPDVQNTAIVLTDGDPTVNVESMEKAIDDVHRSRINVIVVGVTNYVSEKTIKEISSPPHEVYLKN